MAEALKKIVGEKVIGKDGKQVDVETFCGDGKIVGLYFSAHWCPPCRMFTPKVGEFYEKVHTAKNLEIIFVSCDRDEKSFKEYFATMPFLAMPYDDPYKGREEVMGEYGVRGIPTLVFLDGSNGKLITKEGRAEVEKDPSGAKFPSWKK